MQHGGNHAKRIVIDEAIELAERLQNGHGADANTQGKAIALIVRMITPLYEAELVTVQECAQVRESCVRKITSALEKNRILNRSKIKSNSGQMKVKIGPVELSGKPVTSLIFKALGLVPFCVLFFMLGKLLEWW